MLAQQPEFQKSYLVVCPESNMRFQALNLGKEAKRVFPGNDTVLVMEERRFDVGVRTDNLSKEAMAEGVNDDMRRGAVHIWERFLSARALEITEERHARHGGGSGISEGDFRAISLDDVRAEFCTEIENFKRKVEPPKDPTRDPKVTYTGKDGGGFDDMVMAFLVANFSSKLFYDSEEYRNFQ